MSRRWSARSRQRALIVVTVVVAALFTGAGSAAAHPFGPPPTALVAARGDSVFIEWAAAPDDAMVVGMAIGVVSDDNIDEYLEGPVQVAPPQEVEERLDESDRLVAYLLENIDVEQDGQACEGTVVQVEDFLRQGARLVYECPQDVERVDLSVTVLHDVHEAYRTFAITEGDGAPSQSVFTTTDPSQTWDFTVPREEAPTRDPNDPIDLAWLPPVVVGVLAAFAAGGFMWYRRRASA
jgi:hypothetical protein